MNEIQQSVIDDEYIFCDGTLLINHSDGETTKVSVEEYIDYYVERIDHTLESSSDQLKRDTLKEVFEVEGKLGDVLKRNNSLNEYEEEYKKFKSKFFDLWRDIENTTVMKLDSNDNPVIVKKGS